MDLKQALQNEPKRGPELQQILNISQATFSRLVSESKNEIFQFGERRRSFYAARRTIFGIGDHFPLYLVNESGEVISLGTLYAVQSRGFVLERTTRAKSYLPFRHLPYFLQDLAPQGYLGRLTVKKLQSVFAPERLQDWNDDHIAHYLCTFGSDGMGNFLIGVNSFQQFQNFKKTFDEKKDPVKISDRKKKYPEIAANLETLGNPGSSAAGEQPKFTTIKLDNNKKLTPVLVKFATHPRMRDLLRAEHFALNYLSTNTDISISKTELIETDAFTFLESERFDRVGAFGRKGVISLQSLEAEHIGDSRNWSYSANLLEKRGLISSKTRDEIIFLDAFGAAILNSDRHYGNLSFEFGLDQKKYPLAPVYDMLPMALAPRATGSVPSIDEISEPMPSPETNSAWKVASTHAKHYWTEISHSDLFSQEFRKIARKITS